MDSSAGQPGQSLRVLHVLNHCNWGHGNAHVAIDLACEQVKQGHVVGYASEGGDLLSVLEGSGVEHFDLDQTTARLFRWPAMTRRLVQLIDEFKPDIVHAHMMTAAAIGFLATRLKGVLLVTHIHNSFDHHSILMGLGDSIIAVSKATAESCIARGMSPRKMRVVLNGTIGTARLDAVAPPPVGFQRPAIGTLCGLHPRKGVDQLIKAFELTYARRQDLRLYVIGDGPCRGEYEEQAKQSSACDAIYFVGGVDDPRPYLASIDVFALASLAEPFGLVVAEARWAGCAIVTTNVDGLPEAMDNGKAGLLVPPKDPKAMAAAFLSVLQSPETLALAKAASRTGAGHYTVARAARDVEAVYREALARKRSPAASQGAALPAGPTLSGK